MNTYDSEIMSLEELCEWLMIGRTDMSNASTYHITQFLYFYSWILFQPI